ncbi:MAG: deoxyguanosinetriphosphate triphosphohydrolase [Acidaminococcaceae bacterium]|nr:deoxyguanosinetriphosphate triphosphohydrolase [Acidaminococcaceae bacterium]MDD4721630.1 deoxyguanosinetriphosphate triphosphohydrolase [Acidaminococcaceae bacterium]
MQIREKTEAREQKLLALWATKSTMATRIHEEEMDPIRTAFQRDRDRILHSTAFRKLKHKTQVYLASGDHYRTRLTHSMEVAQISRTIAGALDLNEDLVEAAALGHDIGHTPFGHAGERAMAECVGNFHHNEQSLRVADIYGRNGRGLNLTVQVREAILCHTGEILPTTLEGMIVRRCDRIAYLCHDYDDGSSVGMIGPDSLPEMVAKRLGTDPSVILDVLVNNIVELSLNKPQINLDSYYEEAVSAFRSFMFDQVYTCPAMMIEQKKAEHVVKTLMNMFLELPERLPREEQAYIESFGVEQVCIDYVAGLTDEAAVRIFRKYFEPII